jgi:large subunit ribosomal protein L25
MKLKMSPRSGEKKSETNQLRRAGNIPAVLYSKGKEGQSLSIVGAEFAAVLRKIKEGTLPTTRFTLIDEAGKEIPAIVKGIQYHVTSYDVIHLDFEELHEDQTVNIKVPIDCVGAAECVGIKLGGVLRRVIRHMKVRCLPKHIPANFTLDVQSLEMKQFKRLADVVVSEGITLLDNPQEVAVVIVKR